MPGLDEWDVSSKQLANAHGYAARTDYHKDNAKAQATMQLAREILRLARSTLLIHLNIMRARRNADAAKEALLQKRSIQEYRSAQAALARAISRLRVKHSENI